MNLLNLLWDYAISFANWFWGPPILILIGGGGIWCALWLGAIQIRKFPYICSQTFGKMFSKAGDGEISPFSAAVAALASSIGASNIVGVPVAIVLGGPGAIFWMWVLAILGAGTKYTEVVLGIKYREKNEAGDWTGGPFYYCSKGIGGSFGKLLGMWFAFFLMLELIPSVTTQAASAAKNVATLNLPVNINLGGMNFNMVAIFIAVVVLLVVVGGFQRIASVTDKMVPFMAGIYIIGALIVIGSNYQNIIPVFESIFAGAFTGTAATGGFAGSTLAMAIRWGAARGVYSNEAGMGTAPMGHSTASVDHPVRQGMWGVFEVTVDTLIVCSITAICVLTSGMWTDASVQPNGQFDPGSIPSMAFRSFYGPAGDWFITACVFMFVLSTIIVVVFYGEKQAEFLFGYKFAKFWKYIYIVAIIIGGFEFQLGDLFSITDLFMALVIIPNMIAVIALTPKVRELTKEFFNTPGKYYLADKEAKKAKK